MDGCSSGLCRSPLWHRMARFFHHPRANWRILVFEIFRLEQYKSYVGLRLRFLWEKKESFELLVLKLSIPVRASVKRAFAGGGLPQSEQMSSGIPMRELPGPSRPGLVRLLRASQKHGLVCRKHAAGVSVLWQERCALHQTRRVGDDPSGCPGRASGQSCGADETVGPRHGGLCCWSPAWPPQQHPPTGHGGDFSRRAHFCLSGGALARRVDQRALVAPDELPHTSLIS